MIYLLRHGQTDWNLERKIQGHLDMALNETGRKEALICLDKIVSLNIDNIISSDLVRAKETAQIINEKLHLPVRFDSRLREINFGNLQGRLIQDITQDEWDIFNKTPHEVNAESWEDVYLRVKSFFDELDDIKNTLIVTHGGVIRIAKYLSQNPHSFDWNEYEKTALHLKIKNTEVFRWSKNSLLERID